MRDDGTSVSLTGTLRIDGLAAFADPDVLAAVGATPYAEEVVATNASPSDAVRVTIRAALPGEITSVDGHGHGQQRVVDRAARRSQLDLGSTAVDDHGTAKIWGFAANAALIALAAWCLLAVAFISWVVRQRKRRAASPQPPNAVT